MTKVCSLFSLSACGIYKITLNIKINEQGLGLLHGMVALIISFHLRM